MSNKAKTGSWVLIVLVLLSIYLTSAIAANVFSVFSVTEPTKDGNVALIPLKGVIVGDSRGGFDGETVSQSFIEMLEKATDDEDILAVIFEVNSPGGSAVASEEISDAIKEFNKTKVAWIREVGASGAYWAASASDHIIASRMSATGSIGVLSSYLEFAGFLKDHNVTYRRLISGKYKDSGSPFKELTREEESMKLKQLEKVHDYFIESVASNRGLSVKEVEKLATGQVYLGEEALEAGLVDEIGSREDAVEFIEKKLNITVDLVEYHQRKSLTDLFGLVSKTSFKAELGFQDVVMT